MSKQIWFYDTCFEAAKQCKTIKEFRVKYPVAYFVACRNKWRTDYTWLERALDIYQDKLDNVYAYFFEEQHAVYIGRSVDPRKRHRQHKSGPSSVLNFSRQNKTPFPSMTILKRDITPLEGLEWEDYYVYKYREEGWNVLNKGKTGVACGSLGSCRHKWSYSKLYDLAKQYNSLKEFRKSCMGAYLAANKNGWLKDYYWLEREHKPHNYWTYEQCENAAKNSASLEDFRNNYPGAFRKSSKNGWIKEWDFIPRERVPRNYWTYEHCKEIALTCKSRGELQKKNGSAYTVCRINKWLDDFFPKAA